MKTVLAVFDLLRMDRRTEIHGEKIGIFEFAKKYLS
jgi:hypothetical protein